MVVAILPVRAGDYEEDRLPLLPVYTGDDENNLPLLPVNTGTVTPLLPVLANLNNPSDNNVGDDKEDDDGGWWGAASSSSGLHLIIILLSHAAVIGIGAPCAREAPARPVLCGAVMPRVVLALLIGIALLYAGMFKVSETKALCLTGAIAAGTLLAVQSMALLSRLLGDEASLSTLLQPVGAAVSFLTMIGAWLFTFQEEAMRKIFGLTTGDT